MGRKVYIQIVVSSGNQICDPRRRSLLLSLRTKRDVKYIQSQQPAGYRNIRYLRGSNSQHAAQKTFVKRDYSSFPFSNASLSCDVTSIFWCYKVNNVFLFIISTEPLRKIVGRLLKNTKLSV